MVATRIILHGKAAGNAGVRTAVRAVRQSHPVEVRVTWEPGDATRLTAEAVADAGTGKVSCIVAGAPSNPIEPKDAGVTSAVESLKDSSVTLPSSPETVRRVAEEKMQGDIEPKNSVPERGIMGTLSAAFQFALVAIATLVCVVIYLFIRWRTTGQRTVAVSLPEKNSDGAGNTPVETTIGAAREAVKTLADNTIQQPNQTENLQGLR